MFITTGQDVLGRQQHLLKRGGQPSLKHGGPMAFADGQFQIIYNGELYNFQELRAALLKLGVQFRTR